MPFCSNCGKESPGDASFCPACGALLAATPGPPEARKTVTVVFCDLAGSTNMGDRLDPESVRRFMSRFYAEMRSVLERHGGTVEKYIGDAVMAVFGIPTLHEDDALRAVRAAAEMQDALGVLNDELEQKWAVRLQVRTGVNTGKVVAGDPAKGHAFVVGDAVNVAARLEQRAGSGEVLIGEETYRLVRDEATVEATAPLSLKGKPEPLSAYKLLDLSPSRPALDRRHQSPIVGRKRELTTLQEGFEAAARGQSCQLCTVVGPAGIGKSRLTEEFIATLGDRATVLRGRCLPYGEGITYWAVAEIVRQAAKLVEGESATEARAKIAALLARGEDATEIVERIGAAVGFSESASSTEETFWGVRRLLESLARDLPVVIVFDDIHWGEATFLDLIEHLVVRGRGTMLLMCLARPDLLERRPDFASAVEDATTMLLDPLDASQSEQLIMNLVGEETIPHGLAQRLGEHADGNPLFVGEMVRMLVDEGLLESEDDRSHTTTETSPLKVPPTIEALLGARLDQLKVQERALLERASVIGEDFPTGAVLELSPEAERETAGAQLDALVEKELIRKQQASFAGEPTYSFTHILVRDVAYHNLLKESRSELHERLAGWLHAKVGQRVTEYEEIIGYHLEQAYSYRSEIGVIDESARAVARRGAEHLASAGRRAFARGDVAAAANLLTRASALLPANDLFRLAIHLDAAEALMQGGELPRADSLLAETIEEAARQDERGLECHARIIHLTLQLWTDPEGRVEKGLQELQRAIPILEELGEERALAKAWRLGAELHLFALRHADMETAAERALEYARRSGDEAERHQIQSQLIEAVLGGPTPVPVAIGRMEALLEQAPDDPRVKAYTMGALSYLHAMSGNFDEARRLGAVGRSMCEEHEWRYLLGAGASQVDGEVELLADDPVAAERAMRPGYELLVAIGEKSSLSTVAAMLAEALYRQGDDEEAERFTALSEEAAASQDVAAQLGWRATRAKVLARRGELAEAESLVREAVTLAQSTDSPNVQADTLLSLAEVLRLGDRADEAAPIIDVAIDLYEAKGNLASAARARSIRDEPSPARR